MILCDSEKKLMTIDGNAIDVLTEFGVLCHGFKDIGVPKEIMVNLIEKTFSEELFDRKTLKVAQPEKFRGAKQFFDGLKEFKGGS